MRVVFLEDVEGVALGGEVKNVKSGFARNYLIPKQLAIVATRDSLQRVEKLKNYAEDTRLKKLSDMKSLGEKLDGLQVNIPMRAGASGRLYGSVTNALVAEGLGKLADRQIDRRTIEIPESIRQVGLHQVRVRLHADVSANIELLVYPDGTDPSEFVPPEIVEEKTQDEPSFEEVIEAELAPDTDSSSDSTRDVQEVVEEPSESYMDAGQVAEVNSVEDKEEPDTVDTGKDVSQG